MKSYFFTFGSDPEYPFGREQYVEIKAPDMGTACKLFKAVYPNRPKSNCLNCAAIYPEETFHGIRECYYKDKKPAVLIDMKFPEVDS